MNSIGKAKWLTLYYLLDAATVQFALEEGVDKIGKLVDSDISYDFVTYVAWKAGRISEVERHRRMSEHYDAKRKRCSRRRA